MRVYSDSQLSTRMAGFHFVMKFSERLEKLVSYLPLFLVFGILGWGYYAFVVIYCLKSFQFWKEKGDTANLLWTALATIWFHVNMFLVVYSYGRCAFSDPGYLQEDIEDETETEVNHHQHELTFVEPVRRPRRSYCAVIRKRG